MPLTLRKLTDHVASATVRVKVPGEDGEGEEVHVKYKPGVLTPALENELRAYGEKSEGWADLASKLLVEWDILGDDGAPVPLTFEALQGVPSWIIQSVVAGIRGDLSPNSKSGEPSAASS